MAILRLSKASDLCPKHFKLWVRSPAVPVPFRKLSAVSPSPPPPQENAGGNRNHLLGSSGSRQLPVLGPVEWASVISDSSLGTNSSPSSFSCSVCPRSGTPPQGLPVHNQHRQAENKSSVDEGLLVASVALAA